MLHLMRQTMPCCLGASVAVTTLYIRNRAFHTEQIKAGLAMDHSWTHLSTYGFCDCTKSGNFVQSKKCKEVHTKGERINTMYGCSNTTARENTICGCSNTTESSGVLVWQCRTAKSEHPVAKKKKEYCNFALEKLLFLQIKAEESNFGCLRMVFNSPHSTFPIKYKPTNSRSLL